MCASNVQVDDVAWFFKHLVHLLFVLLPALLVSLQLLILVLTFRGKLGLVDVYALTLAFELASLRSE